MEYPIVDMKRTGLRIRELMKLNNIKTKDIVEYMGFESEQSVYKWLRGDSLPKVDNLFALSRLFDTPMDNIIMEREGEDESPLLPRYWKNLTCSSLMAFAREIRILFVDYVDCFA